MNIVMVGLWALFTVILLVTLMELGSVVGLVALGGLVVSSFLMDINRND